MAWVALNCPQCSAPLPRVAIWRAVTCGSCGALINRTESVVLRDTFRQSWVRSRQGFGLSDGNLRCGGQEYHLIDLLGSGEISQVHLAQRMGALPYLAIIKLSSSPSATARYAREAVVSRELQALQSGGADGYFSQRLPEVVAQGMVEGYHLQNALVLRYSPGFWGSLAALNGRFPEGIDPRHSVWIWRRMLEILGYIHARGWSHGDIRPDHALVHPGDHGVRLIGWASAQKEGNANDQAKDLMHSARIIQVLLSGTHAAGTIPSHVPAELSRLVSQAGGDQKYCRTQGANGLDMLLRAAAITAFGPPQYVPLIL